MAQSERTNSPSWIMMSPLQRSRSTASTPAAYTGSENFPNASVVGLSMHAFAHASVASSSLAAVAFPAPPDLNVPRSTDAISSQLRTLQCRNIFNRSVNFCTQSVRAVKKTGKVINESCGCRVARIGLGLSSESCALDIKVKIEASSALKMSSPVTSISISCPMLRSENSHLSLLTPPPVMSFFLTSSHL